MKIKLGQAYSFIQPGVRYSQEDARFPDVDLPAENQRVFVVCDGVGGNDKGEVASRTVCDAIGEALAQRDLSKPLSEKDFSLVLGKAYQALDKAAEQAREMSTTMALMVFHGAGALVAHIGDSRIYQVRPGVGIMYRSDDHSLVNAMIHAGKLSPDAAETYPKRHYVTRSMSCATDMRAPAEVLQITNIEEGDYFVLATDGLINEVSDSELEEIFNLEIQDEEKVKMLQKISENSDDNSAVIVVLVVDVIKDEPLTHKTQRKSSIITEELPSLGDGVVSQVMPKDSFLNRLKKLFKK